MRRDSPGMCIKLLTVLMIVVFIGVITANPSHASTKIRVGVYQDFPLVFVDNNNKAQGVYVDILDHIAARENWSLEYVSCKWADCLNLLETGKIDLLTAIAFSKKRTQKYNFNEETVFPNWGQVYTTQNIKIDSIADLAGKTVAGLAQDIYFRSLKEITSKAKIDVIYTGVDEYEEVFRLIEKEDVDAGILPRLFGDLNEKRFNVKKTTTIVRPSELRFAAPKSSKLAILAVIDKHLSKLTADSNSLYFRSIAKWLGQQKKQAESEIEFTKKEKRWLAEHNSVLLGVDPKFVPFEFIDDDGNYRGMCADYVRSLSERIGIAMDIVPNLTWNEAVEQARIQKVDVLPCVGMTEKRKEFLTYSNPHQTFYRVFVTKEGSDIDNSVDDLQGRQVAVQKNSSHHGFLQDNTNIKPILFDTAGQAIDSVSQGRSDVFIGNENMTGYAINKNGIVNLKMTRLSGAVGKNLYFAVRNDWPELVTIINKGLASISEKEKEAIKQKWIAVTIEKQIDYTLLYQVAAAVLCLGLIFGAWNTQIRRQRKKLRESERRYRSLADNSEVGILQIKPDGTTIYANPAMVKMIDAKGPEEVKGRNIIDFIAPAFREFVAKEREKRHQNISSTYECEFISLREVQKNVMISAAPILNDSGKLESIISSIVDISDRKTAEEELRSAMNAAESANLAKSTFLANMSHELRTPLNAILGFSELMMRDTNLSPEQLSNLESIGHSGEHLLDLINDVLEISKIEAGRIVLQPDNFDLYHLLFMIEEMFSLRARKMGLALTVERTANVPQFIRADEGKLRQTLINLLGNAVKFTQQGEITLRVNSEGQMLLFEVEDTGVGIAQEELDIVFDVFVQSTSGQESKQGSGLGIPISQKFVKMMGGELTVVSDVGKGTKFRFDVKIEIADGADVAASGPELRVIGLAPDQSKYRLLVVEDNEPSRKLLVTLLGKIGFEVRGAADGQDAVKAWEEWQPHLIWMDLRMPVLDGYEATKQIKSLVKGSQTAIDTKIIALTASAFEENKTKAFDSGCNDFVRKPFREAAIFNMMAKHLGVRFVYKEDDGQDQQAAATEQLSAVDLKSLMAGKSAELLERLTEATDSCDADKIDHIIGDIRIHNSLLGDALAQLSGKFAYNEIMNLISKAKSSN
ncbi:MAG: transporter substrate-binding domain-containing protein [Proteobacteria bacterium]|nr:transporter substrate-binding domain-containing protein [Pseudomonadota bacterium]